MHSLLRQTSWCRRRHLYGQLKHWEDILSKRCHSKSRLWTSADVRQTFLEYFKARDHLYVHSSSVVPRKDEGTYFVNAGMNQFKPVFLGTVDPTSDMANYRRVVNSQKCIRVGGKHNDLEDVGRDTYHHTFFEMLGTWSFGDYFKKEACEMVWTLLTEVYKLPKERLFVTYFGGDKSLQLEPDLECRDIWLQLGVEASHVHAYGSADNFWDMGDTGPCGPCTEIHYDRTGRGDAASLINTGHPAVIELWNLVFMQYDRQPDGSLLSLPSRHVDTGMGLERMAAVMQNKDSNYDTDLFTPLFNAIQKMSGCPVYSGRLGSDDNEGIDKAYRIVADHARMFTVAIADGVRPGRNNVDSKLRLVLDQCLHQASKVLKLPKRGLANLVPVVTDILGPTFPEIHKEVQSIKDVVNDSEDRYLAMYKAGNKLVKKLVETDSNGQPCLTASSLMELQDGKWGVSVPVEMAINIAKELGIQNVDVLGFNVALEKSKEKQKTSSTAGAKLKHKLSHQDAVQLESRGIPRTADTYKYSASWRASPSLCEVDFCESCRLLAIKTPSQFVDRISEGQRCGLLFDKTPFYSESGGQMGDIGLWTSEDCEFVILDVQETRGYVLHSGYVQRGRLTVDSLLKPQVDWEHRSACAKNHTATHLLNFALTQILGDSKQQGSSVTAEKLVFDFTCNKVKVKASEVQKIVKIVKDVVASSLPVHVNEMSLKSAKAIKGLKMLQNEVYPAQVRVVSVGEKPGELQGGAGTLRSVELCGGTHVDNTSRVGDFVVTHFHGMQQGTKRVTAVTGKAATQALHNVDVMARQLEDLERSLKHEEEMDVWVEKQCHIESLLTGSEALMLPKVERDHFLAQIDLLKTRGVNKQKNKQELLPYVKELQTIMEANSDSKYIVSVLSGNPLVKQMVAVIDSCKPSCPTLLLAEKQAPTKKTAKKKATQAGFVMSVVAFIPNTQDECSFTPQAWIEKTCSDTGIEIMSTADLTKSAESSQLYGVTVRVPQKDALDLCIKSARDIIEKAWTSINESSVFKS